MPKVVDVERAYECGMSLELIVRSGLSVSNATASDIPEYVVVRVEDDLRFWWPRSATNVLLPEELQRRKTLVRRLLKNAGGIANPGYDHR